METVVDRLVIKENMGKRLADSVETALRYGEGSIVVVILENKEEELLFSEKFACSYCNISYPELEPRLFSFNNPQGACSQCDGLGIKMVIDPELVIPNPKLSIRDGALKPWEKRSSIYFHQMLDTISTHFKFKLSTPFEKLPKKIGNILLFGSGDEPIKYYFEKDGRKQFYTDTFDGVIPELERRYRETDSSSAREEIARYMRPLSCQSCDGNRLRKEAISVKIADLNIVELTAFSIGKSHQFFEELHHILKLY